MKRIATMTFHMAHNFGAMLQAYALEKTINSMGMDCEVLDYRFPYIDQWSGVRNRAELMQENGLILGNLRYLKRILTGYYQRLDPMRRKFDSFMRTQIRLSKKVYFNKKELEKTKYDIIVFGSDQIWNVKLTNGLATEYMGSFADVSRTKLVAYAASCGTNALQEDDDTQIAFLLQRFNALGIRERTFAEELNKHYGLNAINVLDPVFLLDQNKWDDLAKKAEIIIDTPYVLVYAFQVDELIFNIARKIANQKKLKLVAICYNEQQDLEDFLQITDCGPIDFVSLIKNAEFICTTSFHGMAFSIIYEKNFYCVRHPLYGKRSEDLLKLLGLEDRMLASEEIDAMAYACDYTNVEKKLKENIRTSRQFLEKNLM